MGCTMEERRKNRRMDLGCKLLVNRIDNGNTEEVDINIQDVSKTGVGFISNKNLEMDAIYESHITIWTKEVIHTLLKIVRKQEHEGGYLYGATFLGLTDIDAFRISVYEALDEEAHKG